MDLINIKTQLNLTINDHNLLCELRMCVEIIRKSIFRATIFINSRYSDLCLLWATVATTINRCWHAFISTSTTRSAISVVMIYRHFKFSYPQQSNTMNENQKGQGKCIIGAENRTNILMIYVHFERERL